ncbi:mucin-3B-like isoform X2 [Ruditapes philippinarum]|uniref:mucin-3B-like isoform X2 n=1 Tax=Ruditapes philippinarum TaxID=129788 RepID=UPI00295B0123|nr:mucin-3B-like isoform X2 [Ruditapes philippinarum]
MAMKHAVRFYFGIVVINVVRTTGNKLPEPLIRYDNHNSVCYGPGTHGQLRPSCPNTDSVIAIQGLKVGAKPLSKNCPSSVTEWTNHTGSYLVDHSNISVILDETACCLPDEIEDCLFDYNYTNSGLDHYYHKGSSGYTKSRPNMEVSWQSTNCKNASLYPAGTNYMVMDYSCIERNRIGDMCSNKTYNVTSGAFYLTNTDYPKSVVSTIASCECQIQTNGTNIQFYSVDIRPGMHGDICKQGVNITDSNGVTTWNCKETPLFNITELTKGHLITVNLTNDLEEDGGHIFMGFSGVGSEMLTVSCSYEMKHESPKPTSTATLNTLQPTESVSIKHTSMSILQPSETTTRHTPTFQTSESLSIAQSSIVYTVNSISTLTLQTSEGTSAFHSSISQYSESNPILHTSLQSSRRSSASSTTTLKFSERKSEVLPTKVSTIDETMTRYTPDVPNDESVSTLNSFALQSSEITSTMQQLTSQISKGTIDQATFETWETTFKVQQSTKETILPTSANFKHSTLQSNTVMKTHSQIHLQDSLITQTERERSLSSIMTSTAIQTAHVVSHKRTTLNSIQKSSFVQNTLFPTSSVIVITDKYTPSLGLSSFISSSSGVSTSSTDTSATSTSSSSGLSINQSVVNKEPKYVIIVLIVCMVILLSVVILVMITIIMHFRMSRRQRAVGIEEGAELQNINVVHRGNRQAINVQRVSRMHFFENVNENEVNNDDSGTMSDESTSGADSNTNINSDHHEDTDNTDTNASSIHIHHEDTDNTHTNASSIGDHNEDINNTDIHSNSIGEYLEESNNTDTDSDSTGNFNEETNSTDTDLEPNDDNYHAKTNNELHLNHFSSNFDSKLKCIQKKSANNSHVEPGYNISQEASN